MNDGLIRLLLIAIAAITVVTGLAQLVAPERLLALVARDPNALGSHLFATVGMFMVITGAMFLQCLLKRSTERAVPFWICVQKAAAAVLVVWAITRGLFVPLAAAVAAFDAATAILAFVFWNRMSSFK